jgi:hypothetical protein
MLHIVKTYQQGTIMDTNEDFWIKFDDMVSPFANPALDHPLLSDFDPPQNPTLALPPPPPMTLQRCCSIEIEDLRAKLMDVAETCGKTITMTRFKREAIRAWMRKHPDYKTPVNPFQAFVKDNIKEVRTNNPAQHHGEHMKMLGGMWREKKRARQEI